MKLLNTFYTSLVCRTFNKQFGLDIENKPYVSQIVKYTRNNDFYTNNKRYIQESAVAMEYKGIPLSLRGTLCGKALVGSEYILFADITESADYASCLDTPEFSEYLYDKGYSLNTDTTPYKSVLKELINKQIQDGKDITDLYQLPCTQLALTSEKVPEDLKNCLFEKVNCISLLGFGSYVIDIHDPSTVKDISEVISWYSVTYGQAYIYISSDTMRTDTLVHLLNTIGYAKLKNMIV